MLYDLKTTCPLARWTESGRDQLQYGIPGLKPCALISDGDGKPYSWMYTVTCAVANRGFSSRHGSRAECVKETSDWLNHLHCPGEVNRRETSDAGGVPGPRRATEAASADGSGPTPKKPS
jgi:hypothetical protein